MRNVDWDRRYADRELLWSAEPNRFVAGELAALPAGSALDLACGEGRNAIWLARRGWRVTAVDFSAVALDKARVLAGRQGVEVDWVLADLLEHEPTAGAYDLVLVSYLHLPAEEMAAVLGAAARAVADGGTLLLVGHDLSNLTEGVGGPQDQEVLHTPESVVAALAGLTVVHAGRVRRPVDTEDGPREAVDTLVRVTRTRP